MSLNLGEVYNYPGVMAVLVEALKKKGVRFDVPSFKDGEITYTEDNIMVLRGAAYEIMHRAFKSKPCSVPGKKPPLDFSSGTVPMNASGFGA